MSAFTDAVAHHLQGVHFFSTGAMKGCPDCNLEGVECPECEGSGSVWVGFHASPPSPCVKCKGTGKLEVLDGEVDIANEAHFSWSQCDSCGSRLGGDRHPAHGVISASMAGAQEPDANVTHFDICTDCVMYHANGDEPEAWGEEVKNDGHRS